MSTTERPRFVETFRSKPQVGEVLPKAEFIPLPELTAGPSGWYTIPKLVGGGLALSQM